MELMVVIVILGMLAATVSFGVQKFLVVSKQSTARSELATIKGALTSFQSVEGRFPTEQEGLDAVVQAGFLDGDTKDPWGNEYEYFLTSTRDEDTFEIICYGADGKPGGSGKNLDISSNDLSTDNP